MNVLNNKQSGCQMAKIWNKMFVYYRRIVSRNRFFAEYKVKFADRFWDAGI